MDLRPTMPGRRRGGLRIPVELGLPGPARLFGFFDLPGLPFCLSAFFMCAMRFPSLSWFLASDIRLAVGPTLANMYTNKTLEGYMQSVTAIDVATIAPIVSPPASPALNAASTAYVPRMRQKTTVIRMHRENSSS